MTSYTAAALSTCRECCGGHGYAAVNRFGMWRSDHDIFQTFEGDNTVLLQQARGALRCCLWTGATDAPPEAAERVITPQYRVACHALFVTDPSPFFPRSLEH